MEKDFHQIEILKYLLNKADEKFIDEIFTYVNKKSNIKMKEENMKKFIGEDTEDKKKEIIDLISKIEDSYEFEKILSFINRKFIRDNIREFMLEKIGSVGYNIDNLITNIIVESPSSYKSKIDLITHLREKKYIFKGSRILENKKGNFYELNEISNQCFESIKKQIVNLDGSLGFRQVQGAGELYFSLFGKDIMFSSKSDLKILDKNVEVKSSRRSKSGDINGGRFSGTSFYGNMSSAAKVFFDSLKKVGISEEKIEKYRKELNLNIKGLTNLNGLIKSHSVKYEDVFNIFRNIFKIILMKMDEKRIEHYINRFLNFDGTVNISEFFKTCALISFEYYKQIEGFDILLMINTDSGNYIIIENVEDLENNIENMKISNIPSWSEGRKPSISPQIVIY